MKFAYLIMAHDNEEQLNLLIESLDYSENDIYLHIDKKSGIKRDFYKTKNAKLNIYSRYAVYWGDLSQTKCQMFLLSEAVKEKHDYYHLISGHDFPIKSHSMIMQFFQDNYGKQFIHFESNDYSNKESCKYYHLLAPLITRCNNVFLKDLLSRVEKRILSIQKKNNVNRLIYRGANWYSITHDFAEEFCAHSKDVIRKVRWTISSDECVLQTFYKTIAQGRYELFAETNDDYDCRAIMREIDWHRGLPYVWKNEDYSFLINSGMMYARKFDQKTDAIIIERIMERIK